MRRLRRPYYRPREHPHLRSCGCQLDIWCASDIQDASIPLGFSGWYVVQRLGGGTRRVSILRTGAGVSFNV